jgi:hypothetical protein
MESWESWTLGILGESWTGILEESGGIGRILETHHIFSKFLATSSLLLKFLAEQWRRGDGKAS